MKKRIPDGDFYTRRRTRFTPNFLYSFYIARGKWETMASQRMVQIIEDEILPGVVYQKKVRATEILTEINRQLCGLSN